MSKQRFKVFEDCRFVKGYGRSIVYDLSRNSYKLIPNSLLELIDKCNGLTVEQAKLFYDNKFDDTIDEYFHFLIENEFVFFTDEPDHFPSLDLEWLSNSIISNAIICESHLHHDYLEISKLLEELNCKAIQLRFFNIVDLTYLTDVLNNFARSRIKDIEIIMPYNATFDNKALTKLIESNPRITSFFLFLSNVDKVAFLDDAKTLPIYHTTSIISDNSFCGVIHPKNFKINTRFFCESQHFNCCLNQKIAIDTIGNIKNCPSAANNFGNIKNITLKQVIQSEDFQRLWQITKDTIDVCKDCEFRYMCMDCRAYIKDPNNIYSQPAKCTYNPYIAKWKGQDGYISVDEWKLK